MRMKYLNLGCGSRFHPEWENVDFYATGPNVRVHDLREKMPYADGTFDAVYHSHVLEHFPREAALLLLRECHRVLRRGGIIRVAVPDLERIARLYLEALEKVSSGVQGWDHNYEWMVIEMLDQCVREGPSSELAEYFRQDPIPNWDFILGRWGTYATTFLEDFRRRNSSGPDSSPRSGRAWGYVLRNPGTVLRNKILRMLIGQENWEALPIGRYRRSGVIHMWMYDYYSLGKLLQKAGFLRPQRVGPAESRIPDWTNFDLDTDRDGRIYKPDSMYMEACKP
jgi:predicted SAM-dependent methyltransferase